LNKKSVNKKQHPICQQKYTAQTCQPHCKAEHYATCTGRVLLQIVKEKWHLCTS